MLCKVFDLDKKGVIFSCEGDISHMVKKRFISVVYLREDKTIKESGKRRV